MFPGLESGMSSPTRINRTRLPGHPADLATFGDKGCGKGGAFGCLGWNLCMD